MHPLDTSLPEASNVPTGVPKMVPHKHSNRSDRDAVYTFDLKIAPDQGFVLYNTMPTDASVKVLKFNRNHSESEILSDKRPPQVTEVTRTKRPSAALY